MPNNLSPSLPPDMKNIFECIVFLSELCRELSTTGKSSVNLNEDDASSQRTLRFHPSLSIVEFDKHEAITLPQSEDRRRNMQVSVKKITNIQPQL
jgi:hypothetical protein